MDSRRATRVPDSSPVSSPGRWDGWTLLLPILSTPVLTFVLGVAVRKAAGMPHGRFLPPGELAVQLVLAWALLAIARHPVPFVLAQFVLVLACHAAQALRVVMLGGPIRPPDFQAASELLRVLDLRWALTLSAPLVLLAALVVSNLGFRRLAALAAAAGAALLAGASLFRPAAAAALADGGAPYIPWSQTVNMLEQGPVGYLYGELARRRLDRSDPPTHDEVRAALASAPAVPRRAESLPGSPGASRPVVLILLESFWDPAALRAAGLSGDPVDPRFRALWQAGGGSSALSPEFGGGTANSEMEVLCGIPTRLVLPGIVFSSSLANELPCLPRLLSGDGLPAAAFHPNVPDFWNRDRAYPRLGFSRYFSSTAFVADDLNGEFLSDESLYRQAWARTQPPSGTAAALTFVLTYTGHWPYPLNAERRAYEISAASAPPVVGRYASSILHSSRELVAFVDRVLAESPEALVVALGDHLPVLGESVDVYRESGLFEAWVPDFTPAMFRALAAVPLLVVDGRSGPVDVGTISQFEIPALVLERLGLPVPPWMAALLPPPGWHIRTREEGMLVLTPDGEGLVCRAPDQAPACSVAFEWLQRVRVISRDLVEGRRHALPLASREPATTAVP